MRFILMLACEFCVVFASAATNSSLMSPQLTFKENGAVVKKMTLAEMQKILRTREVEIFEPHEKLNKTYKAFSLNEVLKSVYGPAYSERFKQLVMTCQDGYQPNMPLARLQEGEPFLAFREVGKDKFEIYKNNLAVSVAPYYMVWKTPLRGEALQTHLYSGNWPYEIVTIELRK